MMVRGPWVRGAMLLGITLLVYVPAMRSGFVWSDENFVTENPLIHASDGLHRFWFTRDAPDYFPLTSTMLWFEFRLFGRDPTGYHVVNVLLHVASAILLWRVLERLRVPGAWLAALVFALHPVCVESAAWITERKNTLPMVFYWLTLLFFLRYEQSLRPREYALATLSFLLGLLAKTSVAMLPFILLLACWWQRGRITKRDLARAAPFFLLALGLGLVTVWFQYENAIGPEIIREDGLASRVAIAGRAIWFYLGKVLWPVHLCFVYPRWQLGATSLVAFLPAAALVALFAALFLLQRARLPIARPLLAGLGFFVLNLLPVVGLLDIYYMRFALVADHWQYFALPGVIALVVGLGAQVAERLAPPARVLLAAAPVLALAALTWRQQESYRDLETCWKSAIACNPAAFLAHQNLGFVYDRRGDLDAAGRCYAEALRLEPDYPEAINGRAAMMARRGEVDAAIAELRRAVRLRPHYLEAHTNLGVLLYERGAYEEARQHLALATAASPFSAVRQRYLGQSLEQLGRRDEALPHYREAVRQAPGDVAARYVLGRALLQSGAREEAIQQFRAILRLDPRHEAAARQLNAALEQK